MLTDKSQTLTTSLKEERWWPWGLDQAGAPRWLQEDFAQAPALACPSMGDPLHSQ